MADKPYSFRLEAASALRQALDSFLSNAPERKKSEYLVLLIQDGLTHRGLLTESPQNVQQGSMDDLRNDLRYELETTLKDFVRDLLKDSGRMSELNTAHERIIAGDISEDELNNMLEDFK